MKKVAISVMAVIVAILAGFIFMKAFNALRWEHSVLNDRIGAVESSVYHLSRSVEVHYWQEKTYSFEYPWLESEETVLIAHAMGGIDGHTYTNSKEALHLAYDNGFRVFEVDFQLVNGELIMLHDLERITEMCSLSEDEFNAKSFLDSCIYGKYTPMNWEMVLEFMKSHPDAYIMTDTKYDMQPYMSNVISELVIQALEYDPELLDRVIIQIYNQPMLDVVMDIYPFKSVVYTLYMSTDTEEQVKTFCAQSGVKAVTMPSGTHPDSFIAYLDAMGVHSLVHTVNHEPFANDLAEAGYSAIYTDFLLPMSK